MRYDQQEEAQCYEDYLLAINLLLHVSVVFADLGEEGD